MSGTPVLARAADFQTAWYFSLVLFVIGLTGVIGTVYVALAVRRLWRAGERGPAAVLAGATTVAFLALAGMYATAIGGLLITHVANG